MLKGGAVVMRCISTSTLPVLLALTVLVTPPARSQTFTVIHNFTGGTDGATPVSGLTPDSSGNLYSNASTGGLAGACGGTGCGTIYKLVRRGSGWIFSPLYSFSGGSDGAYPDARMVFGANGTLYGTTFAGGNVYGRNGAGVVFNLHPPARISGRVFTPWTETVLHTFAAGDDGANPDGDLLFDPTGNIYGTASCAAGGCGGTVFELIRSGGGWTENILHGFVFGSDEYYPHGGVIFDDVGNLYGVTNGSSSNHGSVFQLAPSDGGWAETALYNFEGFNNGAFPASGLILDSSGNLYGTTGGYGPQGGGTIFELSPSGGSWRFSLLYSFYCSGSGCSLPGPQASLSMDSSGAIFGATTQDGAYGYGNVFKLTPQATGWAYTSLHDFAGGADGAYPYSSVFEDSDGNLFGTAAERGAYGYGVIWEINP